MELHEFQTDLQCVTNGKAADYIQKLWPKQGQSFEEYFEIKHNATANAVDLLKKILNIETNTKYTK